MDTGGKVFTEQELDKLLDRSDMVLPTKTNGKESDEKKTKADSDVTDLNNNGVSHSDDSTKKSADADSKGNADTIADAGSKGNVDTNADADSKGNVDADSKLERSTNFKVIGVTTSENVTI